MHRIKHSYPFNPTLFNTVKKIAFVFLSFISLNVHSQTLKIKDKFTRADSLIGYQSPLRTCYDINYYHLDVKFDIGNKFISGSNLFKFTATRDFNKLQFDLFANLKVEKVIYKGHQLTYNREGNAVFITFPTVIKKGNIEEFTVYYSGNPTVAVKDHDDAGVYFETDSLGKPYVATYSQLTGPSIWWPNKDQLADEVDSALISISVPKGLKDISNGRLRKVTQLKDGYNRFDWFVSNPINNYDIVAHIADYAHFSDTYDGENCKLTLDYWVLPYNLEKAKKQFTANVKPTLKSFEYWFGPYPFYKDGYKLIDAPHPGEEHQSAISYGNHYTNGNNPYGKKIIDYSGTGLGLKWDYIIVHESAHEWFGNSISAKDNADVWIHEAFANYAESLFIESLYGKRAAQEYIHGLRTGILNDQPVVGPYDVNKTGSEDMYAKGAVILNMVRTIINDDEKWHRILLGLNKKFYHQTVTYQDITGYISQQAGVNLAPVFDEYLLHSTYPVLEFMSAKDKQYCRWVAEAAEFNMPVQIRKKGGGYQMIKPTKLFKPVGIESINIDNLEVDTFNYYIGVLVN